MESNRKFVFYPILLTYFLDNFGLAIVYPIFTPLFLSGDPSILSYHSSFFERTALLGLTIAIFPLAQFFGAPLIGELSDRFGRKKTFCITILGTCLGYAVTGLGIAIDHLPLLFFGRLWTGFFAGNLTICLAAIADISIDEETRTKNFGILAAVGGLSFIFAIFIGGSLSILASSLAFWLITVLSLVNFYCMLRFFHESHPPPSAPKKGLRLLEGIHNIRAALEKGTTRRIYMIYFFFMMCWSTSMQFLPAFLIKNYTVSTHALVLTFMGIGAMWSLSNLVANRSLAKHFHPPKTLTVCLSTMSILLLLMLVPEKLPMAMGIFFAAAFFGGLSWTNCLATVSLSADASIQGRILGVNQSVGALAAILAPTLGGVIAGLGTHLVYLFTSISGFAAVYILHSIRKDLENRKPPK
jgi:DHA1 family tetracycline resistance protein-like MFS transporter